MPAAKRRVCKDCGSLSRPAPRPGPRCATCHRAVIRARKDAAHAAYVLKTFGITGEQYWEIHRLQGGRCYLCQRASGRTKRLAVDHDHACCPELPACGRCVRGLLCKPCNRDVLGHLRDDVAAFQRGIDYLTCPPAWAVLRRDELWTPPTYLLPVQGLTTTTATSSADASCGSKA